MTKPQLFHCLRYADADRALKFLHALGFTDVLVVRDEADPTIVQHAQLRWRDNGGVMLGSTRDDAQDGHYAAPSTCNLIVASDDEVDATLARAVAAGGRIAAEPSHPPHGGRSGGVLDPEDNYWNVDSYPGE